mgnify:FL=1|tara:strand:+ start:25 stop:261 length:237 start_codon:yes stop_codon:yes gene_type:complete
MSKKKKHKKTYKELIEKMELYEKEIKLLDSIVRYYREYLERLGILTESYIDMKGDTEKLVEYIEERGKKIEGRWNEKV